MEEEEEREEEGEMEGDELLATVVSAPAAHMLCMWPSFCQVDKARVTWEERLSVRNCFHQIDLGASLYSIFLLICCCC